MRKQRLRPKKAVNVGVVSPPIFLNNIQVNPVNGDLILLIPVQFDGTLARVDVLLSNGALTKEITAEVEVKLSKPGDVSTIQTVQLSNDGVSEQPDIFFSAGTIIECSVVTEALSFADFLSVTLTLKPEIDSRLMERYALPQHGE